MSGTFECSLVGVRTLTEKMASEAAADQELKRLISEMKPHARLLPRKSGGGVIF